MFRPIRSSPELDTNSTEPVHARCSGSATPPLVVISHRQRVCGAVPPTPIWALASIRWIAKLALTNLSSLQSATLIRIERRCLMARYSRSILQIAATAAIVAILWIPAPAIAVEGPAAGSEAAAAAQAAPVEAVPVSVQAAPVQAVASPTAPAAIKRDAPRTIRTATSSYDRRANPVRVTPVQANLECSGFSCTRRLFLVMLGVGY
jgi:hypothetical protein